MKRWWVARKPLTMDERTEKFVRVVASGCWEWIGSRTTDGYGDTFFDGKVRKAHRVYFEHRRGPIPEGLTIDHLCRNRACVNPDHLEAVTHAENCRRARHSHCSHGHAFDSQNTYLNPNGSRQCKTCRRRIDRARYELKSKERSVCV